MNPKETHVQKTVEVVPSSPTSLVNAGNPALAPVPLPEFSSLPSPVLKTLIDTIHDTDSLVRRFQNELNIDTNMTGRERARLVGVKSRNYGFISKAYDIAFNNPDFAPPHFRLPDMAETLTYLEQARQLTIVVEQLRHLSDDFLLITCDQAYRDALRIYGNLREQSRAKVPGADALFQQLLQYFTLHRRGSGEGEPTEHELERDFRSLIHGHSDGEIIIKNESAHKSGGVHEVVDDVHKHGKSGAEIKVKEEE